MPTPALVVMGVPPPPACYEHHNLVRVERHLFRGTVSFLTIRESGNRLATRASEPYEEGARARSVSVACIRLNVIAMHCQYGASRGTICQGSPSSQIITLPAIVSSSTNIATASAISSGWRRTSGRSWSRPFFRCHLGAAGSGGRGVYPPRTDTIDANTHLLF